MLHHNIKTRNDIPYLCKGGVGIELGVLHGHYSEIILKRSNLDFLISIDAWAIPNWSNSKEHNETIQRLSKFGCRSIILQTQFNTAARLITNNFADFIYIDGYHDYKSIKRDIKIWWPKLKKGGILSGHDYEKGLTVNELGQAVPFGVIQAVGELVAEKYLKLHITGVGGEWDWDYRSWYLYK